MKAAQYTDMGKYLRDVRESQRIKVEDAAVSLHIRAKYLYDLENGNFDNMPGKVYIRGYIKNYAEYLRLDSSEVLEEYEKLFESANQNFFVPENSIYKNTPSHATLWFSFIGLLVLYAYWYFGIYSHSFVHAPAIQPPATQFTSAMDSGWESCLGSDTPLCFLNLHAKGVVPIDTLIEKSLENQNKQATEPENEKEENDEDDDE